MHSAERARENHSVLACLFPLMSKHIASQQANNTSDGGGGGEEKTSQVLGRWTRTWGKTRVWGSCPGAPYACYCPGYTTEFHIQLHWLWQPNMQQSR